MQDRVHNYIDELIDAGKTVEDIAASLASGGWPKEAIYDALMQHGRVFANDDTADDTYEEEQADTKEDDDRDTTDKADEEKVESSFTDDMSDEELELIDFVDGEEETTPQVAKVYEPQDVVPSARDDVYSYDSEHFVTDEFTDAPGDLLTKNGISYEPTTPQVAHEAQPQLVSTTETALLAENDTEERNAFLKEETPEVIEQQKYFQALEENSSQSFSLPKDDNLLGATHFSPVSSVNEQPEPVDPEETNLDIIQGKRRSRKKIITGIFGIIATLMLAGGIYGFWQNLSRSNDIHLANGGNVSTQDKNSDQDGDQTTGILDSVSSLIETGASQPPAVDAGFSQHGDPNFTALIADGWKIADTYEPGATTIALTSASFSNDPQNAPMISMSIDTQKDGVDQKLKSLTGVNHRVIQDIEQVSNRVAYRYVEVELEFPPEISGPIRLVSSTATKGSFTIGSEAAGPAATWDQHAGEIQKMLLSLEPACDTTSQDGIGTSPRLVCR